MSDFSPKHRVTVHHTGSFGNGGVCGATEGSSPLAYIEGDHEGAPGFEATALSMGPSGRKTVRLEPKDAYVGHDPVSGKGE